MARNASADDSDPRRPPGRIVIVGAVTRDVFEDRVASGGAVSFAARVAAAFGHRACILTIGARDDAEVMTTPRSAHPEPVEGRAGSALDGHEVCWIESSTTLTYGHRFPGGVRELTVLERPDRVLTRDDLPEEWTDAEVLVLAPLLPDDIDIPAFRTLPEVRERALLAQGLLREVTVGKPVRNTSGFPDRLFGATSPDTSVFLSGEETDDWPRAAAEAVWSASRRLVVTRGDRGVDVRSGMRRFHVQPARSGPVVDTTGAGDVFATAFILALAAGDDEGQAARLASVYAAANIERLGASPLPPVEEARRRLEAMPATARPGRLSE
jgi:hypothetical protein